MLENMPNEVLVLGSIFIGLCITLVTFFLSKKIGTIVEVILLLISIAFFFIIYPLWEAMMLMSYVTIAYGVFGMKIDRENRAKQLELMKKLKRTPFVELIQPREDTRIIVDFLLTFFVILGSVLFYIFAPETFAVMKFLIVVILIGVLAQVIERAGHFYSTKVYWLPKEERLVILSKFQSRAFPIRDLKDVQQESSPDLLKLHPLFTFLSSNQDYTSSFQPVLKLAFPGENIFITPKEIQKWYDILSMYIVGERSVEMKKVLPLWHPFVLKRLFWKGYFAITVKGVSAYTGLLFILIWLDVSAFAMTGFILFWWIFNLYVSDRVLIAATDAVEITEGDVFERAQILFKKAKIPHVKLFEVDSPIHNGLATGMNVSRGTVMVTKATLQLSIEAVEAIIAHEAIHIKKRDVLVNQIARLSFFGLVAGTVYLFYEQIVMLADNLYILLPLFYCLMLAFPIYLSFVSQWTEVRADHLGAQLLTGGRRQMEKGLQELGEALDQTLSKAVEYSAIDERQETKIKMRNLKRNSWLIRLIEFQFLAHPPLYWRIQMLTFPMSWHAAKRKWMVGRLKESLPDIRKIRVK